MPNPCYLLRLLFSAAVTVLLLASSISCAVFLSPLLGPQYDVEVGKPELLYFVDEEGRPLPPTSSDQAPVLTRESHREIKEMVVELDEWQR